MELNANSIAQEVVAEAGRMQAAGAPGEVGAAAAAGPLDFCSIWATARPFIHAIASIAIFIPGVGAKGAAALKVLIQVGDQVAAAQGCP